MNSIFQFGDTVKGYDVPVVNEREVRASAGILFLFAMLSFMNAWLLGDFYPTKIFVIAFLTEFIIRIFVNPNYAPTIIVSKLILRNQVPEYTGAAQKKFAWSLGLILATSMFYLVVLNDMVGPINLFICVTCLTLLFYESVFGICIGCYIFNMFTKNNLHLCPGGVCTPHRIQKTQLTTFFQVAVLVVFIGFLFYIPRMIGYIGLARHLIIPQAIQKEAIIGGTCVPPDWAVKMGHSEMWKLHNKCK